MALSRTTLHDPTHVAYDVIIILRHPREVDEVSKFSEELVLLAFKLLTCNIRDDTCYFVKCNEGNQEELLHNHLVSGESVFLVFIRDDVVFVECDDERASKRSSCVTSLEQCLLVGFILECIVGLHCPQ